MKHIHKGALVLAAALLLVLGGCDEPESWQIGNTIAGSLETPSGSQDVSGARQMTFELTPDNESHMAQGKLLFTLTGARVVTRAQDLPEGDFYPFDNMFYLYGADGGMIYYSHPAKENTLDFIQEDGSLVEGCYMILLDVTLENQDCRMITLDEDQDKGIFYDPYLFKGQNFFDLRDVGPGTPKEGNTYLPNFFSNYGEEYSEEDEERYENYPSNYMLAVRVEPGETRSVTFGYVIYRRDDGALPDPAGFCAATHILDSDGKDFLLVDLNLEAPEELKELL